MEYYKLAAVYEHLQTTTKRIEKTKIVAQFLKNVPPHILENIVILLQGTVFPAWDERKLGFSTNSAKKAIAAATGASEQQVEKTWKKCGDLGLAAEELMQKSRQKTLVMKALTTTSIITTLQQLSTLEGEGAVDKKKNLVAKLLQTSTPVEAKYIIKTVLEELRAGCGEGVLRDALIGAFLPPIAGIPPHEHLEPKEPFLTFEELCQLNQTDLKKYTQISSQHPREFYTQLVELVQQALDMTNDFGKIAALLKEKAIPALKNISLTPGTPIAVMLATKEDDITTGMDRTGTPAALEYKLDGFRLQIHKDSVGKITLFTRRLENVTAQFPEIVDAAKHTIQAKEFITDGEAVGIEVGTGKFVPFQQISQRIRRKYDIEELAKRIPVIVQLFDILHLNGKDTLKLTLRQRRELLRSVLPKDTKTISLVREMITSSTDDAKQFYETALGSGIEGVIIKKLDSPYIPGKRVGMWVKVKPTMETLDLVIIKAEWGEGKRASWLSSFTVACNHNNDLLEIGKVSTGLKELESEGLSFSKLSEMLKPFICEEHEREVILKPSIVVEIAFEEIQKSPTYSSGFALRFPRIIRLREDKGVPQTSSLALVKKMYATQRGRLNQEKEV